MISDHTLRLVAQLGHAWAFTGVNSIKGDNSQTPMMRHELRFFMNRAVHESCQALSEGYTSSRFLRAAGTAALMR